MYFIIEFIDEIALLAAVVHLGCPEGWRNRGLAA
jgi:hypothetical protein